MTEFSLIDGRAHHCGQIVRKMRAKQQEAMMKAGVSLHAEVRSRFHSSCYTKAWLIDGELAALGGAIGSLGGSACFIWLVTTEKATLHPTAMVRAVQGQIAYLSSAYRILNTVLIGADEPSKNFAAFLGFSPDGYGAMSRYGRRSVLDIIDNTPEIRIPFGETFAVPVSYSERLN